MKLGLAYFEEEILEGLGLNILGSSRRGGGFWYVSSKYRVRRNISVDDIVASKCIPDGRRYNIMMIQLMEAVFEYWAC